MKIQTLLLFSFAVSFTGLIFIIDISVKPGLSTAVLYSLIILYSWLLPGGRSSVIIALLCSGLTLVGLIIHLNQNGDATITGINRFISLTAIWITTALVVMAKQSMHSLLGSYKNLEKQVEQRARELRRKDKLVRTMVDSVHDHAIFLIEKNGVIGTWNVGAARIFGYTGLEIIGRKMESFIPPAVLATGQMEALVNDAGRTGEASGEWELLKSDGSQFPASVSLSAQHSESKEPVAGFTVIVRDLSRQKQWEEVHKNQAALEAKNTELDCLVGFASDSFREPIKNFKNLLSIIHQDVTKSTPQTEEYFQSAYRLLEHLTSNVDALLDYGRVGMTEPMEELDLNEIINEIEIELKPRLLEEKVRFVIPRLPTITGQKNGLRLLFQNLLARPLGRWADETERTIQLSVEQDEVFWKFTLEDNSETIGPVQRENIFDFYAVNGSRSYDGRMAYCKRTVNLHYGSIWLEAVLPVGNAFHFTLAASQLKKAG